jgi:NadR type nicotinamide-nucleotide adenylyltransferase
MEARHKNSNGLKKIAIIGPECTGKTTLSKQLAEYYNTQWIPEYAREFVLKLNHPYTYADVETIAQQQQQQIQANYEPLNNYIFFDTELIITKVWFDVVFKKEPEWLTKAIEESNFDLYFLCSPDLPWEPDTVRENGGKMRDKLFQIYKSELDKNNFKYFIIEGVDKVRLQKSIDILTSYFK